jgi:septal ring factor EnvC (AmiA/AmiB activator)
MKSLLPAPDANSLRTLQDEIASLAETLREKQETETKLKQERSRLSSEPSDSLIDRCRASRFPFLSYLYC